MASRTEFYLGDRHPQVGLEPKDDLGAVIDWDAAIQDQIEEMIEAIDSKREEANAMRDTRLVKAGAWINIWQTIKGIRLHLGSNNLLM